MALLLSGLATRDADAQWGQSLTNYTWTGGGAAGTWSDPNNWATQFGTTNGYPSNLWSGAYIPTAVTFTVGVPNSVNVLTTGVGRVVFGTGMSFPYNSSPYSEGKLYIGSGGADFGAGTLSFPNGGALISSAGDLIAGTFSFGNSTLINQSGGLFYVTDFSLPGNNIGVFSISAWQFASNKPSSIGNAGTPTSPIFFNASPVFQAGQRPNWVFSSGTVAPGAKVDLNGKTIFGNQLSLTGGGAPGTRYCYLSNSVAGGIVDVNSVIIGNGGYTMCYVDMDSISLYVRGSGTAWDNRSTNNLPFELTNTTTTTFAPTGGTMSVSTGSKDRNSVLLDPIDWNSNFAFDVIKIGSNSTITLTGTANIEGGGTNALYATSIDGLGPGAVIMLNGHNVYLKKRANNVTVDKTGGGKLYQAQAGTVILIK